MKRRRARAVCAPVLLALALAAPAGAARFWPPAGAPVQPVQHGTPAPATPGATSRGVPGDAVTLQMNDRGSHYEVVARNEAPGPMQVRLDVARADNLRAVPALPAEAVVAAGESRVVARLYPVDPRRGVVFDLALAQTPGDPRARPRDFEYRVPFDAAIRVDQGFGGHASHNDAQNFYAVDFALPEGTPVLAARGGTVFQVESDFQRAGMDRERYGGRANYVRILHDDGSMALYAHLQAHGVQVRVGQQVRQGEPVGLSGNTGYSSAPHLHFVVQVNAGMQLRAIPFRMSSALGELKFAREATSPVASGPAPR